MRAGVSIVFALIEVYRIMKKIRRLLILMATVVGAISIGYAPVCQPLAKGESTDSRAVPAAYDSSSEKGSPPDRLQIYMINVGQGDSALVIFPDDRTMLIDSGIDRSGKAIIALLGRLGIGKLDILVSTHGHPDHVRGFSGVVLKGYTTPYTVAYSCEDGSWNGLPWRGLNPGEVIYSSGGATATCYAVDGYVADGTYVDPDRDQNARSVVLNVKFGGFDYLTGGDLTGEGNHSNLEDPVGDALAALGIHIDVLKVHHHGSRRSSNLYFLQRIMPEFAMISVGDGNYFRHPTQAVIDRLNDPSVGVRRIFQTERGSNGIAPNVTVANGQIVITTDGVHYSFINEGPGSTTFSYGPYPVDECVWPMFRHGSHDKEYTVTPGEKICGASFGVCYS